MGDEVGFNFFKGVPRESAAVKDGGVFRLAEVKQVGWVKHAATVTKQLRRESVILSGISVNDPGSQIPARRFSSGNNQPRGGPFRGRALRLLFFRRHDAGMEARFVLIAQRHV
jgi:hypothetical protein